MNNFLSIEQALRTFKFITASLFIFMLSTTVQAGWQVEWIDKFDGDGVNWDNWTAQTNANYNNEVQCYTDDESSANQNYQVSDGTLQIIARKQAISCPGLGGAQKSWTSGRLNSKDKAEFLYGRIEARIKFHNLEGGTWPAFWMLENRINQQPIKNDDDFSFWPNPGAGEIDVWEWFSNQPNTFITNFFNTNGCANEVRYSYPNGGNDVLQWHKYAMEWDENNISFFIDDTLVTSHNISACAQYKEPMFILLNVAMGGSLGGSIDSSLNKATMEVDYVAHCTPDPSNSSAYCDEATPNNTVILDDDQDGVNNDLDLCPNTPLNSVVDSDGCIVTVPPVVGDDDQDGVNNDLDLCPDTPLNSAVDSDGCIVTVPPVVADDDQDGVNNDLDLCPNTPLNSDVDNDGCIVIEEPEQPEQPVQPNQAPVALAIGPTEQIFAGDYVQLSAASSTDADNDTLQYLWSQTAGPQIELLNITSSSATFKAPTVTEQTSFSFKVEVTDGKLTDTAVVTQDIYPEAEVATETQTNNEAVDDDNSSGGSIGTLTILMLLLLRRNSFTN
ncbi:family 16 glycosylhydrolase [Thalassotalea psychrophila]|uniref:Family 16 glycosylhydrolase n=1 Tax=Thalassotalea psychrophila TaxID=3065647 RepID=A0ABY9TSH3_9GAMM|nr:family 16 glycosylhydrolase [Colwelliaceae bacterium SQ149]